MEYLINLGFTEEEINNLKKDLKKNVLEQLELFPKIVEVNYDILKDIGIKNHKDIFIKHAHMFLQNPNKFKAIFDKYDHADLIRCLEKNGNIIEKL